MDYLGEQGGILDDNIPNSYLFRVIMVGEKLEDLSYFLITKTRASPQQGKKLKEVKLKEKTKLTTRLSDEDAQRIVKG